MSWQTPRLDVYFKDQESTEVGERLAAVNELIECTSNEGLPKTWKANVLRHKVAEENQRRD